MKFTIHDYERMQKPFVNIMRHGVTPRIFHNFLGPKRSRSTTWAQEPQAMRLPGGLPDDSETPPAQDWLRAAIVTKKK